MSPKKQLKSMLGRTAAAVGLYKRDFRSKLLIVAFHRVNDELPEDGLTCRSTKFREFCEFFAEHFRVCSLAEQVSSHQSGADMGGTVSITFDDGYRDNCQPRFSSLQISSAPRKCPSGIGSCASNPVG
jgi:hypothetical protein